MKPLNEMTEQELAAAQEAISTELIRRQELSAELERQQAAEEARKREASAAIAERLKQIDALYAECARIAGENDLSFSYVNPDGVSGWYDSSGWQNSSSNC